MLLSDVKSKNNNMKGTMPTIMEGTPPLTGRALPNLINAVSMFKVKIKIQTSAVLTLTF